jgi:hypothetical protein
MNGPGMSTTENPHAGQGSSVLLDIGGDVGALVIGTPAALAGQEIELRPVDHHEHVMEHGHGHGHGHALPHVGVVPRPAADGEIVHSAVFFEVPAGFYELYLRPAGPVELTVTVCGGKVTYAAWPGR